MNKSQRITIIETDKARLHTEFSIIGTIMKKYEFSNDILSSLDLMRDRIIYKIDCLKKKIFKQIEEKKK